MGVDLAQDQQDAVVQFGVARLRIRREQTLDRKFRQVRLVVQPLAGGFLGDVQMDPFDPALLLLHGQLIDLKQARPALAVQHPGEHKSFVARSRHALKTSSFRSHGRISPAAIDRTVVYDYPIRTAFHFGRINTS